ncbi:hypothetical protein KJ912_01690 [Patescibacteria group bacterium]|nr:hypothetical protein [Patescibacteria group bacterium]
MLLRDLPLEVKKKSFYQEKIKEADGLIKHIDKKDVEILALALKYQTHLWSQDKHFDECKYQKILKTYDFL